MTRGNSKLTMVESAGSQTNILFQLGIGMPLQSTLWVGLQRVRDTSVDFPVYAIDWNQFRSPPVFLCRSPSTARMAGK